jgi:hypothetical protein
MPGDPKGEKSQLLTEPGSGVRNRDELLCVAVAMGAIRAMLSQLSIDRRSRALDGYAGEVRFHAPLQLSTADLESKTVQAREVGGLDNECYPFVDQAFGRHAEGYRDLETAKDDTRSEIKPGCSEIETP